jgi:hypothetical protein
VIVAPLNVTAPDVAGKKPVITLNAVDLPEPFGPIKPTISP